MTRAVVNIIHSDESWQIHSVTRANHQRYAEFCNAEYLALECLDVPMGSHYRHLANIASSRYRQTLFLDVHCIVFQKCPDLFSEVPRDHWGLVDEMGLSRFVELESDTSQIRANAISDSVCWPYIYLIRKICTSVMILPSDSAEHFLPVCADLPVDNSLIDLWLSMNLQLHEVPLKELDRRFNWNWSHRRFHEDLDQAFVVNLSSMPNCIGLLTKLVSEQDTAN